MAKPRKDPVTGLEYKLLRDARGIRRQVLVGENAARKLAHGEAMNRHSIALEDEIVQEYLEGKSIREIAKSKKLRVNTIFYWQNKHPSFREKMKRARADRGAYFEEKAIEAAESAEGSSTEEVAEKRLKVETYKWAAGVNNPDVYGSRTKVVGDPDRPITFVIDTGIRREPEAKEVPNIIGEGPEEPEKEPEKEKG